ncbi:MAG: amidohydrolase family protein [Verrucomicrobia bacterium]|nr:amidohydrolase family protein [Verrucomicrobiota bacterium]
MMRTRESAMVRLTAAGLGLGMLGSSALAADRPNLLFCFADDWGRYASIYTTVESRPSINQVLETPHIDRVARQGVLFKNAFVTSPSCTPCRSSLLSGQYFFRTGRGAILQGATWDPAIPSYPLLLREAGYHLGKSYKVWSPGAPADAPYGGQQHAYEKAGRDFNNFSENATRWVREGLTFAAAKERLLAQVRANFEAFLADRKPGQPFCYWFGPTLTHRAFEKGSGQALWGLDPESLKGRLPQFMPDVPEVRADYTDYMGEIQAWDAGVGVLVQHLEALGELDRTLVVISGDHGMPGVPGGKCNLYDHGVGVALIARGPGVPGGRVVDDFVNLMDLAPTFLEAGGVRPPDVMTGRSFLDVLRSNRSGQVDPSRTYVVTGRERHVAAARDGNLPYPHRALRTAEFLYIRNFAPDRWPMGNPKFTGLVDRPATEALEKNTFVAFADMDASPTKAWLVGRYGQAQWQEHFDYAFARRPAEELYDLKTDPDQTRNVAGDAAYADARQALATQLLEVLTNAGDPRVLGDGQTFDLVVRHGRVADGTGNPAYFTDVAIRDGRIAALGRGLARGRIELDATGLVVAPGFIDVHTHADELHETPEAEHFLRMGVTTLVAGNCGSSARNVGEAFSQIEAQGVSVNFATLVGHGTVRREAMNGSFNRPPTAAELEGMCRRVEQAMEAGAVGLSTGLIYAPSVYAQTEEIVALAKVVARHDGIYATHQRNEGTGILRSLDEVFRIAREAGVRAQVSHLKLAGEKAWGRAEEVLAYLDRARSDGLDITQDQYAYTASSTGLSQLIPDEALEGGRDAFQQRLADPTRKASIVEAMRRKIRDRGRDDYAFAVIAAYRHDPAYNGLNVVEAAQKLRGRATLDDQIETILELQRHGGATGIFHGMNEADLQQFLRHPNTMVACDSGLRRLGDGMPHPRGYGNNARVLARYVRELGILRLEDAIRKMTSLPATTFRFADRGLVRVGGWADLVAFDPAEVRDVSTYKDPHHYATGFRHVLVNGVPVIQHDQLTGARPGKVLRHETQAH